MEKHNIDSKIRKAINESADFYDLEAGKSKDRIWQQVQLNKQNKAKLFWFRALAAACILLFLSTSIITISVIRADQKIKTLIVVNGDLQNQINTNNENTLSHKEFLAANETVNSDTVYVEKIVPVLKPIIKTKQITDTVYIERNVYLENDQAPQFIIAHDNASVVDSSSLVGTNNYESQIYIKNNEKTKPKKERKLKFIFGGKRDIGNQTTFALTTGL